MQLPKIDVQATPLSKLMYAMETGNLQVPRFQRDFVWPLARTRKLLDSMYKEYPIGTFFLWTAPNDAPSLIRPLEAMGIPSPTPGSAISYILDGQQRLTSLFCVVKGVTIGNNDYGQVCIDLDTASRYLANTEEGFDDPIFVKRSPDNQRYVAVCDIASERFADIHDGIPSEYRGASNRAFRLLSTYPFSVVYIATQPLGDAIEIFQRINQAGKPLGRYDLVCANVWRDDFDFRDHVAKANREFEASGFGSLDETIYTMTFALVVKDNCRTAAELSLVTDDIIDIWPKVISSLKLAAEFARGRLGVKRSSYLPYRGTMVVLADFFYHAPSGPITSAISETLWDWFWRVSLSERYSSTSPSRMAEDALELRKLHSGEKVEFSYAPTVTPEAVLRTRMTRTSSTLRNAFICALALCDPRNLADGSSVNLSDPYFSVLKQAERHHVFPVAFLKRQGVAGSRVHMLPNFCFIPADLNRYIGDRAPSDYLAEMKDASSDFAEDAASHLLYVGEDSPLWADDFDAFMSERATIIANTLHDMVSGDPGISETIPVAAPDEDEARVDSVEVALRDLIDQRLGAFSGPAYWKRVVPADVKQMAERLIERELRDSP